MGEVFVGEVFVGGVFVGGVITWVRYSWDGIFKNCYPRIN